MKTATCQHCGKTFEIKYAANPNKYCSKLCSNRANARYGSENKDYVASVELSCATCGKTFYEKPGALIKKTNGSKRLYCSRKCADDAKKLLTGAKRYNFKGAPKLMACEICGTEKLVRYSMQKRFRACSRRCAAEIGRRKWPRISSLETLMADAFAIADMHPDPQHPIAHWTVDFAFTHERLAVECDGDYWHGSRPEQQEKDRNKDHWLQAHGWRILRLRESAIKASPQECVKLVQDALHI